MTDLELVQSCPTIRWAIPIRFVAGMWGCQLCAARGGRLTFANHPTPESFYSHFFPIHRTFDSCIGGKNHNAILTGADDPEFYDSTVLEMVLTEVPNDHQYGYCSDCAAPFRWSVRNQRWEEIRETT